MLQSGRCIPRGNMEIWPVPKLDRSVRGIPIGDSRLGTDPTVGLSGCLADRIYSATTIGDRPQLGNLLIFESGQTLEQDLPGGDLEIRSDPKMDR
jgi:hypothetical protein